MTAIRRTWRLVSTALGIVLLMAGAGCCCVTINMPGQQAGQQMGSPTMPPAGGNFVPVQAVLSTGGSGTICGNAVSGKYVRFHPPAQTPNSGDTGFRGYLWNNSTSAAVPNTHYYLQWFVTVANTGCCTPVAGSATDVSCPVTPGLAYRFTAHFKSGFEPPTGTTILIQGAWTH